MADFIRLIRGPFHAERPPFYFTSLADAARNGRIGASSQRKRFFMRIMLCIDDTDNLESRGTGDLAADIALALKKNSWGECSYITRHQLLVHPDIPYTSHNSAMCFSAEIGDGTLAKVIDHAAAFLARESAVGSDPGLCVAVVDRLECANDFLAFGRRAKETVLSKEEAYAVAHRTGVHLSEHGGTGQGIIGALAGAALRLGGNDGRLKGQLRFTSPGSVISVARLRERDDVDDVRSLDGRSLADNDPVRLGDKVKTVLIDGSAVLLLTPANPAEDGASWRTCSRQQLRNY
jgi:hypothetical protein